MSLLRLAGILSGVLFGIQTFGDTGNYNSVLIGDRAAGMGGAFTAMSGDPSACSFYNPATLALIPGYSFSASASLYNKYDTSFSDAGNLSESTLKLNRGSFQGIPAAAGSALGFKKFSVGLSILTPEYDTFSGDISLNAHPNSNTFINSKDQSLWVGGNLAINFTDKFSAGMTFYYTSRDYFRSTIDQTVSGNHTKLSFETKAFTSNNVVYVLGGLYKITPQFWIGSSMRLPSIQLSGDGSYYKSILDTSVSGVPTVSTRKNIPSQTTIPHKFSLGLSYSIPKKWSIDVDASLYGANTYRDLLDPVAGDQITNQQVLNYAIGGEYYFASWIALRSGLFTNFSSHPDITTGLIRQADHIDMLGFSSNLAIFTGSTSITFGGYFTGGHGQSTQQVNQQIIVTPKVQYIYSMLIASSYVF
ncbi:MAG: outer membrane protein transport protein [Oligoflexia bacterium]|nr:outer membrane protein transport protein [Oligoflexia bacterium]